MKILLFLFVSGLVATISACSDDHSSQATNSPNTATLEPLDFPPTYDDYLNRDVRDDIFYFVMPDRFYNGNPDNDNGSKSISVSQGGLDLTSKWAFHGGDIQGVEAKLDYLKGLGISAIWMTPILRNKAIQSGGFGHHGYWILDFTQIDPHFGSNDDLKNLIDAAHDRGIKIFFDIITNHTADVIRYEECHNPDGSFKDEETCPFKSSEQVASGDGYTPFLPKGSENLKVPAWLNDPKYYNNQGDSYWQGESAIKGDFVGLDDLDTLNPQVIAGMIDIYKNIITEFKPDGFRVDTVKHVDMPFWSQFSPAIIDHAKEIGIPNFHVFGEVYSSDPVLLSSFTTEGKLPSVLDFGFQKAASEVFFDDQSPQVISQLFENDDYYTDQDSRADLLMNFLGNHDMGRAGFFINQNVDGASDEEKLQRVTLAHAFMYLSRGIPVIYYGDEQGFTGDGGDVDAREDMFQSLVDEYNDNQLIGTLNSTADDNFDPSHPLYLALREFAQLRMDHETLRRGETINRYFDPRRQVFAISRVDKQQPVEYFAAFNSSSSSQIITVDATSDKYQQLAGTGSLRVDKGKLEVTVPALSFTLLKASSEIQPTALPEVTLSGFEELEQRVRFDYTLSDATIQKMQLLEVTTELKDAQGNFNEVATDRNAPFSAIVNKELWQQHSNTIRVTISQWNGEAKTVEFTVTDAQQTEQTLLD